MRAMIMMAGLISSPALAADRFDLVCMYGKTEVPYRIDLTRQEACRNRCDRVWKMGSPTSGELKIVDTISNYPDELAETVIVNRLTGQLVHRIGITDPIVETATCEAAEFSGFPAVKF